MSFRSPWRHRWYARGVALLRSLLRPFGGAEKAFIVALTERQNRRVQAHLAQRPAASVLLIMPRCIKKAGCRADVQSSLQECLSCRQCPLGDVAVTCERHQVEALVAFRSHIAFDMARRHRPDLIIASACHDRLVKAMRSVPEIPALLAPLAGMEKMCVNASVDLQWLDGTLADLRRGDGAPAGATATAAATAPAPLRAADCP
jgi:hypothetical protein